MDALIDLRIPWQRRKMILTLGGILLEDGQIWGTDAEETVEPLFIFSRRRRGGEEVRPSFARDGDSGFLLEMEILYFR